MTNPWVQSSLNFAAGWAVASIVASIIYGIFQLERARIYFGIVSTIAIAAVIHEEASNISAVLTVVGLFSLVSFFQTIADLKLAGEKANWFLYFWLSFQTVGSSVILGISLSEHTHPLSWSDTSGPHLWLSGGYNLGLLLTPASISFFRWMFLNIRLHPGLDRHFYPQENSEDEPT